MSRTPYIGYKESTLALRERVRPGDLITCPICGQTHALETADDGSFSIGFYKCNGHTYLGAVDSRSVVNTVPDTQGETDL